MTHHRCLSLSVLAACGFAGAVNAQTIPVIGDILTSAEQTGALFTGTVDYTVTSATTGQLTISLTNSSPLPVGGFLTGLGFRFPIPPADPGTSASLFSVSDADFSVDANGFTAPSFGDYDFGVALGGNFTGGGTPSGGLAIGQSIVAIFTINSANADELNTFDFIGDGSGLVARFRGLNGGLSDTEIAGQVIPAPGSVALFGLSGLLVATRRRGR